MSAIGSEGKMLFVVGARRSGTLWLHRVLTSHPDIAGIPSETHLFSHGIRPLLERLHHGAKGSTLTGAIYVERGAAIEKLRELSDLIFEPYRDGATYLLERTPFHVGVLELIHEIYPTARMVQIIRDGREVARSLAVQGWGPPTVGEAAAEWRDSVTAGRDANQPPELYREVRYEALLRDAAHEADELFQWLGLDHGPEIVQRAARESRAEANVGPSKSGGLGADKWRREWSNEQIAEFEEVAGDLLAELGYEVGLTATKQASQSQRKRLQGAARRRIRDRVSAAGEVDPAHVSQTLVDELISGLTQGSREEFEELLVETASTELIAAAGSRKERGAAAIDLLIEIAANDQAFSARQISAETRIGSPWTTTILRFEAPDGGVTTRVVSVSAEGDRLDGIAVYRLD